MDRPKRSINDRGPLKKAVLCCQFCAKLNNVFYFRTFDKFDICTFCKRYMTGLMIYKDESDLIVEKANGSKDQREQLLELPCPHWATRRHDEREPLEQEEEESESGGIV